MKKVSSLIYIILVICAFVAIFGIILSLKNVVNDEISVTGSATSTSIGSQGSPSVSTSVSVSNQNSSDKEVITFTLNNFTYRAEIGMTWGDWVVSKYGDSNYYWKLGNYIGCDDYASNDSGNVVYYVADTAGNKITVSEYIVPFYNYTIVYETVPF